MQPFHKAPYRLREPGILNRSLWHISLIYRSPRSNPQTVMNGLLEPESESFTGGSGSIPPH
jgi:hypothetical protein